MPRMLLSEVQRDRHSTERSRLCRRCHNCVDTLSGTCSRGVIKDDLDSDRLSIVESGGAFVLSGKKEPCDVVHAETEKRKS